MVLLDNKKRPRASFEIRGREVGNSAIGYEPVSLVILGRGRGGHRRLRNLRNQSLRRQHK